MTPAQSKSIPVLIFTLVMMLLLSMAMFVDHMNGSITKRDHVIDTDTSYWSAKSVETRELDIQVRSQSVSLFEQNPVYFDSQ